MLRAHWYLQAESGVGAAKFAAKTPASKYRRKTLAYSEEMESLPDYFLNRFLVVDDIPYMIDTIAGHCQRKTN